MNSETNQSLTVMGAQVPSSHPHNVINVLYKIEDRVAFRVGILQKFDQWQIGRHSNTTLMLIFRDNMIVSSFGV